MAPLPWSSRLARAVGLGCLEAASVGLASWALVSRKVLYVYARQNALSGTQRRFVFIDMGIAVAIGLVVLAAVLLWKRRQGVDVVERLVRRLSPLALAGLVPFLFDHRLWADWDLVFLPLAAVFGFGARAAALAVVGTGPAFPRLAGHVSALLGRLDRPRARLASRLARVDAPLLVVGIAACAYAAYFADITIEHHRNLHTSSFDMGLEDNLMWNLVHGGPIFRSTPFDGPTGTHLRNHATFFSYVLAPVYWLSPRPETLLAVQATLMGAAAIPLHLHARRHLSPWLAAFVALLYLAYPPLHGANLYDFHYLPLGVFFLWLVLYAVEARRTWLVVVAAALALSVREDVAACLAVLGVLLLVTGKGPRAGAALAVAGGAYFLVMKLGVMPLFAGGKESFVHQYEGLLPADEHGLAAVGGTVLGNPVFTANVVLERDKLVYVLELLVPLLFLPLWRPVGLLLVVPGFVFTLLSTRYPPLNQISFQYTSYWTAFLFPGVVLGLERTREPARRRALAVGLAASMLACTYLYGVVLQHETARGGFEAYRIGTTDDDRQRRAELAALVAQIPADAKVAASEHLLPHVSGRADAYTLRFGLYDAEYLLLEMPAWGDERDVALPVLEKGDFGVLPDGDKGDMVLAKRGAPATLNAAVVWRIVR